MKLLAVDWLKSEERIDHIAKHSSSCVQVRNWTSSFPFSLEILNDKFFLNIKRDDSFCSISLHSTL